MPMSLSRTVPFPKLSFSRLERDALKRRRREAVMDQQ